LIGGNAADRVVVDRLSTGDAGGTRHDPAAAYTRARGRPDP